MRSKKQVKTANKAKKETHPKQVASRPKMARASIAENTRLYALVGRPTKTDFVKVYGPKGPKMTWAQREPLRVLTQSTFRRLSRRKAGPEGLVQTLRPSVAKRLRALAIESGSLVRLRRLDQAVSLF
jgi:hypothetical protein